MSPIRNIIFDLGGVILDIDYNLTRDAFIKLGFKDFETIYSQSKQELIFDLFETGMIRATDFRDVIRNYAEKNFTDSEIDTAWSAMIIQLPAERASFLRKLKEHHRLFLLSNTNEIHENRFKEVITETYGKDELPELFEKSYFSHHIGMRKPNPEIFKKLLKENTLDTKETLFIDDSKQHVEGAAVAGLTSILLDNKKTTLEKLLAQMAGIKL